MGKVISLPPAGSVRRSKRSRAAPGPVEPTLGPVHDDVGEPPELDLRGVHLPRWLMPLIRDQMTVAEQRHPRNSGWMKKSWVSSSVEHFLFQRELEGQPLAFPPEPHRRGLIDILIESVWALEFRVPRVRAALQSSGSTALCEALRGAHIRE